MRQEKRRGRMFIHAEDVAQITGKSYRSSLTILNEIRQSYSKPKGALITYLEFSAFMNLNEEEVLAFLQF